MLSSVVLPFCCWQLILGYSYIPAPFCGSQWVPTVTPLLIMFLPFHSQ